MELSPEPASPQTPESREWGRLRRPSELEVLRGLSHAFGSTEDRPSALSSTIRWVKEALGTDDGEVGIFLAGPAGLRRSVRWSAGASRQGTREGGRNRASARRAAASTKSPVRGHLDERNGWAYAALPMVSRGELVGVVEVVALAAVLEERWETVRAVASQAAIVLRNVRRRDQMRGEASVSEQRAAFIRELIGAATPESVAETVVRFAFLRFRVPVAAWLSGQDRGSHTLVGVRGVRAGGLAELRRHLSTIPRWDTLPVSERDGLRSRFASVSGAGGASTLVVGDLVVFIGGASGEIHRFIAAKAPVVADVMDRLAVVAWAERRNAQLDRSLALTAHELRAPLLAARAAIEHYLHTAGGSGGGAGMGPAEELLRLCSGQLRELAGDVRGLLDWGVGRQRVQLRRTDVGRIVREAVARGTDRTGRTRVAVQGPRRLLIKADGPRLRLAVANLVRNAVDYSPPASPVEVTLHHDDDAVRVTVRDHGPGVPVGERLWIFDPFARGRAGAARSGNGLGLFLARQVAEGHGGRIWVDSNGHGASFTIELPHTSEWQRDPAPAS